MKKIYTLILFCVTSLAHVNAQTLTVANHQPVLGDSYSIIQVDSSGVAALATQTTNAEVWNYTTPNSRTATTTINYQNGTSQSTGSLYPLSSIAKVGGINKEFYVTSSSNTKFHGGSMTISSFAVNYVFSTGVTQAAYPMMYNDFTTTSPFTGTVVTGFGNGTITGGNALVKADGTGTLNLPGMTYTNVIRVKNYIYFNYSALTVTGNVTQETYDYYSLTDSKFPLFTVSSSTITSSAAPTSMQNFAYLNEKYLSIGIKESSKDFFHYSIYPNPAESFFTIELNNENASNVSYELLNALGQSIENNSLPPTKGLSTYSIETNHISPGIYYLKLHVGESIAVKKIIIQ